MLVETKFLRLKTPVTLGSRFDDWRVCWLGGWTRDRLSYIVMVLRPRFDFPDELGEYFYLAEQAS
jgi:hypothetical protein